jgi:hypothetical protein
MSCELLCDSDDEDWDVYDYHPGLNFHDNVVF